MAEPSISKAGGHFKDLFSGQSKDYARFRPRYPDALYEFLKAQPSLHDVVWDCATGNGQAACDLARYFKTVYATDASAAQISNAQQSPNIKYSVAPAEQSGLPGSFADMVTVAQAVHWFDRDRFFTEARRVMKPGAVIACWAYGHLTPDEPELRRLTDKVSREILGSYWDERARLVWNGYETMAFPFTDIKAPDFFLTSSWTLPELIGYFTSHSATQAFIKANGYHPAQPLQDEFLSFWGDPERKIEISTKLTFRAGRKT